MPILSLAREKSSTFESYFIFPFTAWREKTLRDNREVVALEGKKVGSLKDYVEQSWGPSPTTDPYLTTTRIREKILRCWIIDQWGLSF